MRQISSILILLSILLIHSNKGFSQCGNQKLIPEAKLKTKNNYGYATSYSNGYLAVSEYLNDSIAYNAGIIHLYKKENQSWSPVKKIATQNTSSSQVLGSDLICSDSVIIAKGNVYTSNAGANQILYIYRQNQTGEWPSIETERILIEDTVNSDTRVVIFEMEINEKGELAIIYNKYQGSEVQVKIKIIDLKNGNTILLDESLSGEGKNYYGYFTSLVFKTDVLFISNPDYINEAGEVQGAVFVFEKDVNNEWNLNQKAILTSSAPNQHRFGINMAYENDKLYVANSFDENSMHSRLYIFDKPTSGWADMQESRFIEKSYGYTGTEVELIVKDDIIFWTIPVLEENFSIYMPDNSATSGYVKKEIIKPTDIGDDKMEFGTNPISTGNELILSSRHVYQDESNLQNEWVLIYDLEPNSTTDIENYKNAFKGGFISASDDEFGVQISVSQNTMAIGAKGSSYKWGDRAGSVYIYEKLNGAWDFQEKVNAPEEVNEDAFASRIEIFEDLLFVAAPSYDSIIDGAKYNSTGKVYIYEREGGNWEYLTSLVSPDIQSENEQGHFGRNITYYKGYLAISEIKNDLSSTMAGGRVYLYQYNESSKEFNLELQFENEEDYNYDGFGRDVIINDKYMVIGTGNVSRNASRNLKVYVYKLNSEAFQNELPDYRFASSYTDIFSRFGASIEIKDDLLLVGDPNYESTDTNESATGRVYGFKIPENSTMENINYEDFHITPNETVDYAQFGNYISLNGNDLYIQAKDLWYNQNEIDHLYKFDLNSIIEDETAYGSELEMLDNPENNTKTGFGSTLEIDKGFLILGSPEADTKNGFRSGSVFTTILQPSIERIPDLCNNLTEYELSASPQGGTWKLDQVDLGNNLLDISTLTPGNHTVSYYLNGCIEETTFTLNSNRVVESKSPSSITKCTNDEVELFIELNIDQNNTFGWFHKKEIEADYQLLDSAMNLTRIQSTEPGFYKVRLLNSKCDELEEEFQIINHMVFPELNLKGELEFCEPEAALKLENIDSYEKVTWYFKAENNTGYQKLDVNEDQISIDSSGKYYCSIINSNCEFATDTVSVHFRPKLFPELNLKGEQEFCESEIPLRLENSASYEGMTWYFKGENSTSFQRLDIEEDQIIIEASGEYFCGVKSLNCEFPTDTVSIRYRPELQELFIPNVATVNNDGYNDAFRIKTDYPFKQFLISIYDRYGKQVYQTADQDFKWYADNGYAGNYFYLLKYETECGEIDQRKGWVKIIKP
ncbi:gliding motility-associated C-terminal domain-containing protein [Marivirga salinae]|uniref:Gliding motility-associated C-terminal domain-containing protein n=1 Tax=Marivirga salinarum TaxID=3059078 RepID=A0AA51RAE0_9BACT|nr:gliding motility-associated C-terminal domain-containing protein [Marivirga sp. BDSF4-3]WMN11041.1 gliding motility-associated C-terminal domain-containing protein [Marivirga sp. BDSF4-3]